MTIPALHSLYLSLTQNSTPLSLHVEYLWGCWLAHGHTESDLRLVIAYLRKYHYRKDQPQILRGMLRLHKLIDLDRFSADLSDAKAVMRNEMPARTTRDTVLRATGRPINNLDTRPAKGMSEILKGGWEQLRKDAEL